MCVHPTQEDPISRFVRWFEEAKQKEINDPNAMSLATSTQNGQPSVRIVLLKEVNTQGFVFYTNFESRKGRELLVNAKAALCFHWKSLHRQVRVEGMVKEVSSKEADAYFSSRHRVSQLGAWASQQSQLLSGFLELEHRLVSTIARYGLGAIPRPPYWSGFRVIPDVIEFWRERPFRLHERLVFYRQPGKKAWRAVFLYP